MPDILGSEVVQLRAGTEKYPVDFYLKNASSPDSNDGTLPFGTSIVSATADLLDKAGNPVPNIIQSVTVVDTNTVRVLLSYPVDTLEGGKYTLKLICTLDTAMKLVVKARRILIE